MGMKDLMDKAKELTGTATEVAGKVLDEFNEALPTMRALGFTVKDFGVGMGLVPEISAKLIASTDTIDLNKIKELIDKNAEKRSLVTALKALEAAYNIKQDFKDLPLKGVEIDMKLGLPPHVGVRFVNGAEISTATAAAASPRSGA